MNTAQKFARCLANGGHSYGKRTIIRDFMGHRVEVG